MALISVYGTIVKIENQITNVVFLIIPNFIIGIYFTER